MSLFSDFQKVSPFSVISRQVLSFTKYSCTGTVKVSVGDLTTAVDLLIQSVLFTCKNRDNSYSSKGDPLMVTSIAFPMQCY